MSTPDEYRRELDREAERGAQEAARGANPAWGTTTPSPGWGESPAAAGYGQPQGQPPLGQPYAVTVPGQQLLMARDAAHPADVSLPLRGATWGQAIARFFKNYATFKGRASQSEYLWMILTQGLFLLALEGLLILIGVTTGSFDKGAPASPLIMIVPLSLATYVLATLVPWLSLSWRRLHDTDLSGALWCLSFIPYLGSLVVFILCCQRPNPRGARFDVAYPARPY